MSFSHPGRCRNEAAFAALGGTSLIPARPGGTASTAAATRAQSRAIDAIALTRIRGCFHTRAYITAHRREQNPAGIRRCLKRHIARELYRQLNRSMKPLMSP